MLVVGKEANTFSTLHGIANCVKNGTRKIVSSNPASRSLQCCPHLLSVKFENLVHRSFRNKNSNLESNVSHFGVLHWQQRQPPACAPVDMPVWVVLQDRGEVGPMLLAVFHRRILEILMSYFDYLFFKKYIRGFCNFTKVWDVFSRISYYP